MNRSSLLLSLRQLVVRNFYLKFIAAVLTLALYIWVSEDRETVVAGFAPVQMVVPENMALVSDPLDRVKVTIRGRWSDVHRFDVSQLDPIRLDLSPTDQDRIVNITSNMIRVPPGLRVTNVEPASVYVDLEREISRTVSISPQISGEPAPSYAIESLEVTPSTLTVRGPRSRLERLTSIPTETVDISGRSTPLRRQVRLRIDDGLVRPEEDTAVIIDIQFGTQETTRTFRELPVVGVNTRYATSIEPSTTSVTLRGPMNIIEDLGPDVLRAEIDLTREDQRPPGTYSRDVTVQNIPPEVELLRVFPERFRVTTSEP